MIQFFIDIDGVIMNFDAAFTEVINKLFNKQLPKNFCPNDWSWTTHPVNISLKQSDYAYDIFLKERRFKTLKPYPSSLVFLEKLKACGHQIDLITNIPNDHIADRISCLQQHNVCHHHFFNYNTKSEGIKAHSVDTASKLIFIDDHQDNCEDVLTNCPEAEVFIITKPHNMSYTRAKRLDKLASLDLSKI